MITVPPQAWRWQLLLKVRGVFESLGWLTRAYFVSYAVGQVLPTAVGGDASRIYETTKRHPGFGSPIAGSVLLERAIGGAVTLLLAGVGIVLAWGHYDIGAYLWIEALFVVLTLIAGVAFFSRRARRVLRFSVPLLRRLRDRAGRAARLRGHARLSRPPPDAARRLRRDAAGRSSRGSPRSGPRARRSGSTSRSGPTSCSGRCSSS